MSWDLALPFIALGSGAGWAVLAARRAGYGTAVFTFRSLLGGVAALGLAVSAYDLAALSGVRVSWEALTRGGIPAIAAATALGLVEEGAKLAGLLLVVERGFRRGAVLAAAVGVSAGFAAIEATLVLRGDASTPALARATLAPVAHARRAVPLALGVSAWLGRRRTGRAAPLLALAALPIALAISAALHGAADLALALGGAGTTVYAAALAAPALYLFLRRKTKGSARLADPVCAPGATAPRFTGGRPASRLPD
jgi:hypothetical protein